MPAPTPERAPRPDDGRANDDLVPPDPRGAHPSPGVLVGGLGCAGVLAWAVASDGARPYVFLAVAAAAVAATARTVRRPSAARAPRYGLVVVVALVALAQAARVAGPTGSTASAWTAELLLLAADVAVVFVVVAITRHPGSAHRVGDLLDALIVAAALTTLWWPAFIEPVASDESRHGFERVLLATNPLVDILIVAVLVQSLVVTTRKNRAHLPAALGVVLLLAADLRLRSDAWTPGAEPGRAVEAAWLLALVAFAAAAELAGNAPRIPERAPNVRRRVAATVALVVLGPAVMMRIAADDGTLRGSMLVAGVCAVVAMLLVTARLVHLAGTEREWEAERGMNRLAAIVQSSQDAIYVVDRDGIVSYASPSAGAMTEASNTVAGTLLCAHFPEPERTRVAAHLAQATSLDTGATVEVGGHFIDGTGDPREFEMTIVNQLDMRDVAGLVVTVRDVTGRKHLERELAQRALRDDLTGLANRALFMDRLEHALVRLRRSPGTVGVMFMDLDDFKAVNDGLGHSAGDALLVAVADRLRECVRPSDTIARLGGDEFAVLLEEIEDEEDARHTGERLLEALQLPVSIDDLAVNVPASIGIAVTDESAAPGTLMRDADIALYRAKADGKSRVAMFDPSMRWAAYERLRVRTELSRAIEAQALYLMYQPIVVLGTDEIRGAEALLRWDHPTLGGIPPAEFIPLAEESGLILPIGRWVLERACREAVKWNAAAGRDVYVSVNVSAHQLREPQFADEVSEVLAATGLRPELLMLELTESALVDELASSHLVERVVPLGVAIAIDDFGTGYSSLAYLQRLPVDVVKIDRSFVSDIGNDGTRAVVESIAAIARVMGFSSIAEGIETDEQLLQLEAFDCRYGQGYWYSEPIDPERLTMLLRAGGTWRSSAAVPLPAP